KKIKERVVGERGALDFLDALADNANNYIAMMTPTHAKWNQFAPNTRGRLHSLLTLRVAVLRPLLLSIIRKFPKKEVEKAVRQFVCWAVRFLVVGGARTGTVEEGCAERAKEINEGTLKNMKQLTDSMSRIIPNDAEFEAAFATVRVDQR